MLKAVAAAMALTASLGSVAGAAEPERAAGAPTARSPVTERVIVVWEAGVTRGDRLAARADADTTLVRTLGAPGFQLVDPKPGRSTAAAIASLRADPAVRYAVRDGYSALHATTNDPLFGHLWGLSNTGLGVAGFSGALAGADIDALAAWDRTRGTPSTVVAIIDSGYRFDAPDLGPVAWSNPADPPGGGDNDGNGIVDDSRGADFIGSDADSPSIDGDPTDDNLFGGGHGAHVAGTAGAAGNNGVGISGVAQNVRLMPLRVCSYSASEEDTVCLASAQINAINYAGSHGARVANLSLGGLFPSLAVQAAFAANPHVLFVISAGNGGNDGVGDNNDVTPTYPCAYPLANIVCVAATNQADQLAGFSNFGATSVDLGAPGTETLSAYPALLVPFEDDFQVDDFASTWTNAGAGFGRASPGDGPLTSFGMNDSPGAAPAASSVHQVTLTTGAPIPAGSGPCTLSAMRFRNPGPGGSFFYEVLSNDVAVFTNTTSTATGGSAMVPFSTVPIAGLGGTQVKVRFGFTAGGSPTAAHGIWLDDIRFECSAPLTTPPTYAFLDGTSMASPHVSGAAGLLFSLKPSATVAQVKDALLSSVDPVPALAGKTVTGGRLNVARALDVLVPPVTSSPPPPVGTATAPPPAVVATVKCKVPKLKGKRLKRAKRALRRAHCRPGAIVRPARRQRGRLVVKASRPRAGAVRKAGTKVKLILRVARRPHR